MAEVELRYFPEQTAVQILAGGFAAKPNRQEVLAALKLNGYDGCYVDEAAIQQALTKWPKDPEWQTIGERRNAQVQVLISKDKMSASLELTNAQGGYPISVDLVASSLRSAGVNFGIKSSAVNELIQKVLAMPPGHSASGIVAEGLEPEHGRDSQFTALVSTLADRILRPRDDERGKVDFHEFGDLPSVEANVPIMRREPATSGVPGKNVLGEIIEPAAGKELPFMNYAGSVVRESEPDTLYSARAGLPIGKLRGMAVDDVYTVKEVDLSTGNIRFEGNIQVQKDVARNMEVEAQGTLFIGGFVDSGRVFSAGDMVIGKGLSGGLAGNLDELKTKASTDANLWTQFAQFSRLHTGINLIAEKFLLHCYSESKGAIRVGPEGAGRGKLVGGEAHAKAWLKTDYLGDENEVRTQVFINRDAMEAKQVIAHLDVEVTEKLESMRALKATLDKPQVKANAELRSRILATYQDGMTQMAELEQQRKQQMDQWQAQIKQCVVVVTRQIFPGVEINIADKTMKFTRQCGPGTIRYAPDGLQYFPGETALPPMPTNE